MDSAGHKGKARQNNILKHTLLTEPSMTSATSTFNAHLTKALVAANIPWNVLQNKVFRQFLEKYCQQPIPSESTIRKTYLDSEYQKTLAAIREEIGDSCIWVGVDETTDACNRYIANIIVGKFDENEPSPPHLLCSKELKKVNGQSVASIVNKGLQILYPSGINESKVLLLCTDAASYMISASSLLKTFYPNLIHVTCLAHAFHRISETIRNEFPQVNSLISNMKKTFCKAPSCISLFREKLPETPLPPQPILTRWGTWIEAALYYAEHLDHIAAVIEELSADTASISSVKELLKKPALKSDLVYIKANFSFLPAVIAMLERKGAGIYSETS